MASSGWLGEKVVHTWGGYYSRFTSNVYINSITRNPTSVRVRGTIRFSCRTNAGWCYYYHAVNVFANNVALGQIKPYTGGTHIQNQSWSKGFDITINCSNTATSVNLPIRFNDPTTGWVHETVTYSLSFNKYAASPSGIKSTASYTEYSTISTSCSGISWGQRYTYRKLTCDVIYTYQGKTTTINLGTWTDGATSKTVTKTDFNFPANMNVTVKWTASTNIGNSSVSKQLSVKQTNPGPDLSNTTIEASSTGAYAVSVNVDGVDFKYNYTERIIEVFLTYTLDGVDYSTKLGSVSDGSSSLNISYNASSHDKPWTEIPDDLTATIKVVASNGSGTSQKIATLYCQPSYEAYVIEAIPDDEKEKSEEYSGTSFQINNEEGKRVPVSDVEILGNAEQTTYSGKNLLAPRTAEPANATVAEDGKISYNKTATTTYINLTKTTDALVLDAGTYTFSISQAQTGQIAIRFLDSNGATIDTQTIAAGATKITFTLATATARAYFYVRQTTSGTTYTGSFYPMLEKGSTATAYEPYVGGTPAPNPSYPQPISVVTGENVVKVVGKNLLAPFDWTRLSAGITFTASNGGITISGTATSNAFMCGNAEMVDNFPHAILPAGTYTLSVKDGTSGAQVRIVDVSSYAVLAYSEAQSTTFTLTEQHEVSINVRVSSGTVVTTPVTIYPQLELGNQATSYEAYTAQDYEVNLGKNLFDKNGTGILNTAVDANGLGADSPSTYRTIFVPCKPNTTYTVSKTLDSTRNRFAVAYTTTTPTYGTSVSGLIGDSTKSVLTITTGADAKYLVAYVWITGGTESADDMVGSVQVEVGNKATSYAPYFTPLELAKIGTYQDRIYKEGEKWYVEKNVGKVVLDGTETWQQYTTQYTGWFIAYAASKHWGQTSNFLSPDLFICDHFQSHGGNFAVDYGIISSSIYACYAKVPDTVASTVDEFKTWLASNNATVYYALATPTVTEITNESLISQLNELENSYLFEGINSVSTDTANVIPTLKLKYFTKWQDTQPAILSANGRNGTGQFKQIRRVITK